MSKAKKYSLLVEPDGDSWVAKISRQVTSRKSAVSKQKTGFTSREDAHTWGDNELAEFTKILNSSNTRHTEHRKSLMEIKRQRSSRRTDKTAKAKRAATQVGPIIAAEDVDTTDSIDD